MGTQDRSMSFLFLMYWASQPFVLATSYTLGNVSRNFAAVPGPKRFFTVVSILPVFGLTNDIPLMLSEVSPASTFMSRYFTGSSTLMKLHLIWSKIFTFGKLICSMSES